VLLEYSRVVGLASTEMVFARQVVAVVVLLFVKHFEVVVASSVAVASSVVEVVASSVEVVASSVEVVASSVVVVASSSVVVVASSVVVVVLSFAKHVAVASDMLLQEMNCMSFEVVGTSLAVEVVHMLLQEMNCMSFGIVGTFAVVSLIGVEVCTLFAIAVEYKSLVAAGECTL
jgi:hypothetical protein